MAKHSVLYLYSLLWCVLYCSVLFATGPSIADFILVPRLQWLASGANDGISLTILDAFPHLKAVIAKLMALPAVIEYYEKLKK
jgi:glutathione S-transferase